MKTIVHSLGFQSIACKFRVACHVSILLAILIPAVFAAVPVSVIANGGFENGLNGWTVTGNAAIRSSAPYTAAEGIRLLAFNTGNTAADGVVSRTFPTIIGRVYRLDFAAGVLSYQNAVQRIGVTVHGTTTLLSQSVSIPGRSGGNASWIRQSFHFTADRSSTTLTFRDLSQTTKGIDLLLDEVVVTQRKVHTLTAESLLYPGVAVTVHPPDLTGLAGGITRWSRLYEHGTKVNLSVPASVIHVMSPYKTATMRFQEWQVDGVRHDANRETSLILDADHVVVPVYALGPPIITMEPADQTVGLGETATFRVKVDAPGTHYSWRHNGMPIDGAYDSTLTIPNVGAGDAGSYDVVIGDFGGAVTSRAAVLNVSAPDFANGGFENGGEGWEVLGNVRFGPMVRPPGGVGKVAVFNDNDSTPGGSLTQAFATVPGDSYLVTFDIGVVSWVRQDAKLQVEIIGANPPIDQRFSIRGKTDGNIRWEQKSLLFTASQTPVEIVFRDVSTVTRSIDLLLDHVELTRIPDGFQSIPGGTFLMGDSLGNGEYYERPVHAVGLSGFNMGRYEVTGLLWQSVRAWALDHGYDLPLGAAKAGDHPVHSISWQEAVKWCNARSEMEHLTPVYTVLGQVWRNGGADEWNCDFSANGYRLPTEAEWERAARGGLVGKRFPTGEAITHDDANYHSAVYNEDERRRYFYDISPTRGYHPDWNDGLYPDTSPVGSYASNGFGLHDMSGNVYEWCWDSYGEYPADFQMDPRGPAGSGWRIIRGGAWSAGGTQSRVAYRNGFDPAARTYEHGFRLARSAVP